MEMMEHMEMATRILNTAYAASKMDYSPYPPWKSRLKSTHRLKDLRISTKLLIAIDFICDWNDSFF